MSRTPPREPPRKQLMPEVLPAPTAVAPGSPRARTMSHMQRLLGSASTGSPSVNDTHLPQPPAARRRLALLEPQPAPGPPPPPATSNPRERTLRSLKRLAAAAATAASMGACKEAGCGVTGYGVVDPMPPPGRCEGLAGSITAFVKWSPSGNIVLTLGKPGMSGGEYLAHAADAGAGGGTPLADAPADAGEAAAPADAAAPANSAAPGQAFAEPPPGAAPAPQPTGSAAATDQSAATDPSAAPASNLHVNGAVVISAQLTKDSVRVELKPLNDATYFSVELPATCASGPQSVVAEINLDPAQLVDGRPKASVRLFDQSSY